MKAQLIKNLATVVFGCAAITLAGCASVHNVNDTMKRAEGHASEASDLVTTMQTQTGDTRKSVVFSAIPIVDLTPLRVQKSRSVASFGCNPTFAPAAPMDILEFGQTVTRLCGIPVRVTPDAIAVVSGGSLSSNAQGAMGLPAVGQALPSLPTLPSTPSAGAQTVSNTASGYSTRQGSSSLISNIKWAGRPVEGLLNVVTSRLGLSWRRDGDVISIFYLDTRTFNIFAIPAVTSIKSIVQSGTSTTSGVSGSDTSSLSGSSGSNQSTSVETKTDVTTDIKNNINSMLTPSVGRMSMSVSTGTLTVTDTPEVLDRIDRYLNGENKNITKQVLLNVKVLSVTLTDNENLGINWSLVYKSLAGNYGFNLSNAFSSSVDSSSVSGSVNILNSASGSSAAWAGSSLLIKALSEQGRVSTITSPSVTTLNLQPVPVQVARQTSYLASVQTTSTASVGSTTSLTPGTVTTGFNMNLLPYVLPDNHMLLQYSINLSSLLRIRQVTSGNNTIEIPEVDNRIFSQKVRLKSGETLVLSGFEQTVDNGDKKGVGSPNNILLGGGMTTQNQHDVIVVLITPIIMD